MTDEEYWTDVGARLRLVRRALGLTATELSLELGCGRPALSHYEYGRRPLPVCLARQLFERRRVSLDWLYCGDDASLSRALREDITTARQALETTRGRRAVLAPSCPICETKAH